MREIEGPTQYLKDVIRGLKEKKEKECLGREEIKELREELRYFN